MRRFHLRRDVDATGVSGTGTVAEGVEFTDGTCAMRWLSDQTSTAIYSSADAVESIHGHGGNTQIVWADDTDADALLIERGAHRITSGVAVATYELLEKVRGALVEGDAKVALSMIEHALDLSDDDDEVEGEPDEAPGRDVPQAVLTRLDTRCVRWPRVHNPGNYLDPEPRCGDCDGCFADAWLRGDR